MYCVDGDGVKGPVLSRMLLHKLRCGDIDGMTSVQQCSSADSAAVVTDVSQWRPVSEVSDELT